MTHDKQLIERLKPCPFCGWRPAKGDHPAVFHPENRCSLGGWHFSAEGWNTRTNDSTLTAEIEELRAEKAELTEAVAAVKSLIDESSGVGGLHRNGDFAPWGELRSGGRFEDWLSPFDAVLVKHPYFATLAEGIER